MVFWAVGALCGGRMIVETFQTIVFVLWRICTLCMYVHVCISWPGHICNTKFVHSYALQEVPLTLCHRIHNIVHLCIILQPKARKLDRSHSTAKICTYIKVNTWFRAYSRTIADTSTNTTISDDIEAGCCYALIYILCG